MVEGEFASAPLHPPANDVWVVKGNVIVNGNVSSSNQDFMVDSTFAGVSPALKCPLISLALMRQRLLDL